LPKPFLSIIIPARNEALRLPATLEKIGAFIKTQPYPVEVLVIENASTDATLKLVQETARQCDWLRVIHLDQGGKGLAVRVGMLSAAGEYRFICDADLSMPIDQVNRFIPPALSQVEVAIASREVKGAVRHGEPLYRHLVGRVFNTLVRVILLPGLNETQCGFKCFRGDVAQNVFSRQTINGWSFDAEALLIARLLGYRITEIPIDWYFSPHSRVHLVRDSVRMALDLLAIRRQARQGRYGDQV
jgi:glycosyltransferase involved in cell wall biosynthesis